MTWRGPEGIEPRLLADTRVRWPEVIPLARVLVLAPRIEPLLLRNARLRFLPRAGVEVESQLWFCPLVAARSTREIVLHLGLARVLAGELQGATPWPLDQPTAAPAADAARPQLAEVWRFTQAHTRHWSAEDRLERDLRYHALCDDDTAMDRGLKSLLAEIARESDPEGDPARRRDLARLAKRTLPALRPALAARSAATARLLARYAALALGDAGDWSKAAGAPDALPDWLQTKLPRAPTQARLGIEVRADDAHGQVLHLVEPEGDQPAIQLAIELPTALPARLHVAPAGHAGDWHPVRVGTRIPIRPPSPVLRLGTLDGRQWDLVCESLPLDAPPSDAPEPLLLVHAPADREQAQIIAGWLQAQHVAVDLVADDTPADSGESPAPTRILRLWTRAARERWSRTDTEPPVEPVAGLLLRIEDVALPDTGSGGAMLDWLDWKRLGESSAAADLAQAIADWWRDGALPPAAQAGDSAAPTAGATAAGDPDADTAAARAVEIRRLLAELDDPRTEPPRRLGIGDRLDELGDPRPGVGTLEIEVPSVGAPDARAARNARGETQTIHMAADYTPTIQVLIDEINNPETPRKRRLAIGDELDQLGDPRPGVGLLPNGLPNIAWVRVPGGPFIWQGGITRELPTFWMSRYPITNIQFQAFIDDGAYKRLWSGGSFGAPVRARPALAGPWGSPKWWAGLKMPQHEPPQFKSGNRPRTYIDWHEAVAFSRWLNARLALSDNALRLPSELQWEKAARGERGLIYPWGNNYQTGMANLTETRHQMPMNAFDTSVIGAVGLYPMGKSPYGVEDLVGNVWEWCVREGAESESLVNEVQVIRGGSWFQSPDRARTVLRREVDPTGRFQRLGLQTGFNRFAEEQALGWVDLVPWLPPRQAVLAAPPPGPGAAPQAALSTEAQPPQRVARMERSGIRGALVAQAAAEPGQRQGAAFEATSAA